MGDDFYIDTEHWSPSNISYPTWDDVCRFVVSRTKTGVVDRMNESDAVRQMAKFVYDIWNAGDGCPKSLITLSNNTLRKSSLFM